MYLISPGYIVCSYQTRDFKFGILFIILTRVSIDITPKSLEDKLYQGTSIMQHQFHDQKIHFEMYFNDDNIHNSLKSLQRLQFRK